MIENIMHRGIKGIYEAREQAKNWRRYGNKPLEDIYLHVYFIPTL